MSDDQFQILLEQLTAIRHANTISGIAIGFLVGHMLGGWLTTAFSKLFP